VSLEFNQTATDKQRPKSSHFL